VKDYYATLGVPRTATQEEIKRAYRRLSRELHPDVAGATEGAEERFKEVNAAYEVLSDVDKREMFDMGVDPLAPGGGGAPGGGFPFGQASGFGGFGDLFETLFNAAGGGTGRRGPASRVAPGREQLERVSIDLADAVFGLQRELTFSTFLACGSCHGNGCAQGASPETCQACQGRGARERIVRSLLGDMRTAEVCRQCQGFGDLITQPCPECSGHGRVTGTRTVSLEIPAGVDTGNRIRLAGQGEAGPGGGPNGDLFIDLVVKPDRDFVRQGDDLHCALRLPMTAAALGAGLEINTFDGPQAVNVPPGTQPGEMIKLDGLGVGHLRGRGRGDLWIVLQVEVPKDLAEPQAELLRELARQRGEERPEAVLASTSPGLFGRLKDKLQGK